MEGTRQRSHTTVGSTTVAALAAVFGALAAINLVLAVIGASLWSGLVAAGCAALAFLLASIAVRTASGRRDPAVSPEARLPLVVGDGCPAPRATEGRDARGGVVLEVSATGRSRLAP